MTKNTAEPRVILYCRPRCAKCRAVEAWLTRRGIAYTFRDVVAQPDALAEIEQFGLRTLPVTVVDGHAVAGTDLTPLAAWLQ